MERVGQSCGAPLDGQAGLTAREADGSESIYCMYCYADGRFLSPGITLAEMIEIGVAHLAQELGEEQARAYLSALLPTLARWRSEAAGGRV